jgi:CRISPR-associated protein Csy3
MNKAPIQPRTLPPVLSFRRGVVLSDAPISYLNSEGETFPVPVIRHGLRGTQNVNAEEADQNSTVAGGERDWRNLQESESAKTGRDMMKVIVSFQFRCLDLGKTLNSCAGSKKSERNIAQQMRETVDYFVQRAKESEGLREVARRIARNVFNGRWLWRNRLVASQIEIEVKSRNGSGKQWTSDALAVPLDFEKGYSDAEREFGDFLASQLQGNQRDGLAVDATIDFGVQGEMEVFCSQVYVPKERARQSTVSRLLYHLDVGTDGSAQDDDGIKIMGQAAFRDAKIWNALRTIDTWYPDYGEVGFPIPIEPLGASLELNGFFRERGDSAFELFKRLDSINPDDPEGMFCIAVMLRGGVFGQENKEKAKGQENKEPKAQQEVSQS